MLRRLVPTLVAVDTAALFRSHAAALKIFLLAHAPLLGVKRDGGGFLRRQSVVLSDAVLVTAQRREHIRRKLNVTAVFLGGSEYPVEIGKVVASDAVVYLNGYAAAAELFNGVHRPVKCLRHSAQLFVGLTAAAVQRHIYL